MRVKLAQLISRQRDVGLELVWRQSIALAGKASYKSWGGAILVVFCPDFQPLNVNSRAVFVIPVGIDLACHYTPVAWRHLCCCPRDFQEFQADEYFGFVQSNFLFSIHVT